MQSLKHFICTEDKSVDTLQCISELQHLFRNGACSHYPVTRQGVFVGCISAEDVEVANLTDRVEDYLYALEVFYVRANATWFEVLERFARNQTNIMPVLDWDNNYLGYYKEADLMSFLTDTSFLKERGSVIVLACDLVKYASSEISQIVESNGHKILGMFVADLSDKVHVFLKINTESVNEVLQSFRRYGYEILSEHQQDYYVEGLKERLDYIHKYLNI
ncbi:MAG: CBS domain-containing protein [Bacteroidota bacterium]|nr:CBS domain-containing protein [Bacteroidota bacterium]